MAIEASIEGFNFVIRPVICIDATHLKARTRSVLLVVVCKDENEMIYPLAFGFAKYECTESWTWFLKNLYKLIQYPNRVILVSDRHNGIFNAMEAIFPETVHLICAYHLAQNLKRFCKQMDDVISFYYRAMYAYCIKDFDRLMTELKETYRKVYDELQGVGIKKFSRSHSPRKRLRRVVANNNGSSCVMMYFWLRKILLGLGTCLLGLGDFFPDLGDFFSILMISDLKSLLATLKAIYCNATFCLFCALKRSVYGLLNHFDRAHSLMTSVGSNGGCLGGGGTCGSCLDGSRACGGCLGGSGGCDGGRGCIGDAGAYRVNLDGGRGCLGGDGGCDGSGEGCLRSSGGCDGSGELCHDGGGGGGCIGGDRGYLGGRGDCLGGGEGCDGGDEGCLESGRRCDGGGRLYDSGGGSYIGGDRGCLGGGRGCLGGGEGCGRGGGGVSVVWAALVVGVVPTGSTNISF
ncbi:hypothetical protein Ddye_023947 [Dipteronia dyeriana]|uniref:MULE transposase domain-containing protein n=1 Tax=Dipteronia dyeriana TaxID=168575 RepID=A0AAD9TUW0_9ROSI|nr:hypothetical protein Ddye_023947 [Dipteronia dyeriana]